MTTHPLVGGSTFQRQNAYLIIMTSSAKTNRVVRATNMKITNPAALSALIKGDIENTIVASTPGGIEAQEKAGQTDLVASANMPREMKPNRKAFEKVGFRFLAEIDDIFIEAKLPDGWMRSATDHSMHSDILDSIGRQRVSVFYKAAFYDRRASASLTARYQLVMAFDHACNWVPSGKRAWLVSDTGKEMHRSKLFDDMDYKSDGEAQEELQAWLDKNYPNASDPTAYWD